MSTSTWTGGAPRFAPLSRSDVPFTSAPRNHVCANRVLMIEPRSLREKRVEVAVLSSAFERALDEIEVEVRHRMAPQELDGIVVGRHGSRRPAVEEAGGVKQASQVWFVIVRAELWELTVVPTLLPPLFERGVPQVVANLRQRRTRRAESARAREWRRRDRDSRR